MNPYIVFYTFDDHGFEQMKPVFELFNNSSNFDSTLVWAANNGQGPWQAPHTKIEKRLGVKEKKYNLGDVLVARKPSVVIGFRMWWSPDVKVVNHACSLNIPCVMLNHGAMFVHNDAQIYKRTIAGARVNCVWGAYDKRRWARWNKNENQFVITGNPLHDTLSTFECPDLDVPSEYALLLTPRGQRKYLNPSAEMLNKIIPVVAKCHPIDEQKEYYKERYQTFIDAHTLLPLIYKAKFIITNVTSALMPAMFWQKPIFIHSFQANGYHFNNFRNEFTGVFNFKQDTVWNEDIIDSAITATMSDYEYFAHKPDGNNSERVMEVIKKYV